MDLFNIKGLRSANLRIDKITETYPFQNRKNPNRQYQPNESFENILQKEIHKCNEKDLLQGMSSPAQELAYRQAIEEYSQKEGIQNVWV